MSLARGSDHGFWRALRGLQREAREWRQGGEGCISGCQSSCLERGSVEPPASCARCTGDGGKVFRELVPRAEDSQLAPGRLQPREQGG